MISTAQGILDLPIPGKISELKKQIKYTGRSWAIIDIDMTPYQGKTQKVNVTLPGILTRKIAEYVALHGLKSRSAFLADVATAKLTRP